GLVHRTGCRGRDIPALERPAECLGRHRPAVAARAHGAVAGTPLGLPACERHYHHPHATPGRFATRCTWIRPALGALSAPQSADATDRRSPHTTGGASRA